MQPGELGFFDMTGRLILLLLSAIIMGNMSNNTLARAGEDGSWLSDLGEWFTGPMGPMGMAFLLVGAVLVQTKSLTTPGYASGKPTSPVAIGLLVVALVVSLAWVIFW